MTLRLTDLHEGDLVIVADKVNIDGHLARVEKFTREGKVVVRRRWISSRGDPFGPPLEVTLDEILRVEVRA